MPSEPAALVARSVRRPFARNRSFGATRRFSSSPIGSGLPFASCAVPWIWMVSARGLHRALRGHVAHGARVDRAGDLVDDAHDVAGADVRGDADPAGAAGVVDLDEAEPGRRRVLLRHDVRHRAGDDAGRVLDLDRHGLVDVVAAGRDEVAGGERDDVAGAVTAAPAMPGAARPTAADTPASRIAVRARRVDRLGRPRAGVVPDGVVVCRTSVLLLGCAAPGGAALVRARAVSSDPMAPGYVGVDRDGGLRGVPGETGHWSRPAGTMGLAPLPELAFSLLSAELLAGASVPE